MSDEPADEVPVFPLVSHVLLADRKWHRVSSRSFKVNPNTGTYFFRDHMGDVVTGHFGAIGAMKITKSDYDEAIEKIKELREQEPNGDSA